MAAFAKQQLRSLPTIVRLLRVAFVLIVGVVLAALALTRFLDVADVAAGTIGLAALAALAVLGIAYVVVGIIEVGAGALPRRRRFDAALYRLLGERGTWLLATLLFLGGVIAQLIALPQRPGSVVGALLVVLPEEE